MDIVTLGAATRDVFLKTPDLHVGPSLESVTGFVGCVAMGSKVAVEELVLGSGGGATNAAVTFAKFGLKTEAIVRVGEDEPGQAILNELKAVGVEVRRGQRVRGAQSGYSTLLLADNGERTALVFRGVSGEWSKDDLPAAWGSKALYITSLGGNLEVWHLALAQAARENIFTAANPGQGELSAPETFQKLLPSLNLLLLNLQEARTLLKDSSLDPLSAARKLNQKTPYVVVTDGERGAWGVSQTEGGYFASPTGRPAVSRTGAGDALGSGLVAALQQGASLPEALAVGTLNAESVIGHIGAKLGILPNYPSQLEIAKIKVQKLT
jgi:sugar/nucleoside kinase (ribokinase family)